MPKKILSSQRTKFWGLYKQGHTIREAAKRAGFSESYGKGLVREGKGDNSSPGSRPQRFAEEEENTKPKGPDELDPVALDCLDDFERFRARYLGSVSTPWQVEAAQRVVGYLDTPDKEYVVVNCPQGGGKTRLFSHDLTAWVTVRNRALRGIFGSLSQSVSVNLCANLRDTLERTVPARARQEDLARGLAMDAEATLASDYGRFKPVASGGVWRREAFIVEQLTGASMEKEPTWAAISREAKFLGCRVDFMVWDDLINTDMLRNQDRVDDLYRWWDDEAQSRIDPGGLVLLVGQRLRSNDIYRYALDKRVVVDEYSEGSDTRSMYHHILYKAHYDDRCTSDKAAHRIDAQPYPEGCMLDPARIKWRDIQEKRADGNYEVVYQQEDTDPSQVLVQKEWVEDCWDPDRSVGQLPPIPPGSTVVRYMTVDPSPTKWWGCIDWLYVVPPDVDYDAGFRYVIDIHRAKMSANELLDRAQDGTYVGLAEEWQRRAKQQGQPLEWLIAERNGAQRFMMQLEFFRNWCATRSVSLLEHETTSNKTDPTYGVWATIPAQWRYARVRLPGADRASRLAVAPLVAEVTTYPDGATDDLVMSSWFFEPNLDTVVGSVSSRTNDVPFYSDYPVGMFGGRPLSHSEQRIADMIGRAS